MSFAVYATFSVATAFFVFWFGVWMLHLIAIAYGKIKLHKKSRLHQKLQQHDLQSHQNHHHHNYHRSSHYDHLHSANYHNLHQLMQQQQQQNPGPVPQSLQLKLKSSSVGDNKSCDYSKSIKGSVDDPQSVFSANLTAATGGEIVINLNCADDASKDHLTSASSDLQLKSPGSNSTSSSSGISSIASSPDSLCDGASAAVAASMATTGSCTSSDPSTADNSSSAVDSLLLLRNSPQEIVSRLPKVSILKPLMGIDSNLAANLETFFTMDYPRQSYEILFCVENKDDPVLGLCQGLIDKYRGEVEARLFLGGEQVGVNPKINNMEPGYREAKYELIMISDAGIKMRPDTLMDMVEHMTEKVALVHQMPFTCDRDGFAATYEKIFFGTIQSRIYLVSDLLNVICHTGMSCLMRKKVMDGLGGLRAFGCYLAEDFFMAKAITEDGWKTTISSHPALQNSGVCDVKTFQNRLVRWAKLRIAMMSWLILLEPMSECMIVGAFASWGVSILFHWDSLAFYLIHILCWFLSDWMLLTIVQNGSVSFNKFDFVCGWLFRELSGPYLFFCALWNPAIRWRTRVYKLDWGGVANELNSSTKIKT